MGFDEAVKNHKNNLSRSLIEFGEGHRVRGLSISIDNNLSDYDYYFKAGAASRQAEIDELQKHIDLALNKSEDFYNFGDGESAMAFCNEIINILKGKKDE